MERAPEWSVESHVQCFQSAPSRGALTLGAATQGWELKEQHICRKEAPRSGPGDPRAELEWPEPRTMGGPARMVLTPAEEVLSTYGRHCGAGRADAEGPEEAGSLVLPGRH